MTCWKLWACRSWATCSMAAATSHKNIKNALSEIWMQTDVSTVSKTKIDDHSMEPQTSTHKILSSFFLHNYYCMCHYCREKDERSRLTKKVVGAKANPPRNPRRSPKKGIVIAMKIVKAAKPIKLDFTWTSSNMPYDSIRLPKAHFDMHLCLLLSACYHNNQRWLPAYWCRRISIQR